MTTPIDELAGTPLTAEEEAALREQIAADTYWVGPRRVARLLATLDAARQPVADTALREALIDFVLAPGWAADRPSGPRTEKGHVLASSLRRRLPDADIDYDGWIRDIELQAVSAALATREPDPTPLDRLVTALGTHFLKDGSPCFCPRWDAIYGNGDIIHQPRCRLGRMALGYSGDARTVGCAASDDECKARARLAHSKDEP